MGVGVIDVVPHPELTVTLSRIIGEILCQKRQDRIHIRQLHSTDRYLIGDGHKCFGILLALGHVDHPFERHARVMFCFVIDGDLVDDVAVEEIFQCPS